MTLPIPQATSRCLYPLLLTAILSAVPAAHATAQTPSWHWDFEIDPTAYALHGYSAHVGLNVAHLRYDLGVYQAEVPRWLQGNEGFDEKMRGVGLKIQYYFADTHTGWFAGVSVGPSRETLENRQAQMSTSRTLRGVGAEAGYRISIGDRFYATPWAGLDYMPQADNLPVAGVEFTDHRIAPFFAVHVGYRF